MPLLRALPSALFEGLVALASPPRCAACETRVSLQVIFCPPCALSVERAPIGVSDAQAIHLYGGAIAKAITRFKYENQPHLARPLAELLRKAKLPPKRPTMIVPVPLHRRRLADRGFNQAALLAAPLARDWQLPLDVNALERIRDTGRQAELERIARLENMDAAFRATRTLSGHHVLLVDDVCTTGATLRACAAELEVAGATVCSLVLAIAV
ncbi:hypothetical protein BH09MYX1_BH09MYX1_57090 [soil metagenome]